MYVDNEKVIVTDCDGVLLDWEYKFHVWMHDQGYVLDPYAKDDYDISTKYGISKEVGKDLVRSFNQSATIGCLPPLRDAIKYVKKLHEEHGYIFHCITSLSLSKEAYELRLKNLQDVFGSTVFERLVCLDTGADKDDALVPYKNSDCWWLEDKSENADLGVGMGLNTLIVSHPHNSDYTGPAKKVSNWKEIYGLITS
jgi:hypothetical protein